MSVKQTTCCIVGGGPSGLVLALMLAKQNIPVTLLEAHKDFDRDFRGDTLQASAMEIMDELGLADAILAISQIQAPKLTFEINQKEHITVDFSHLKTKYPFVNIIPQVNFLDFISNEAKKYPNFELIMPANVQELIEEDGIIKGVRYPIDGVWQEVRSLVTVAADGRFSRLRKMADLELIKTAPTIDILWFRLPKKPSGDLEVNGLVSRVKSGHILIIVDRQEYWQFAYMLSKGGYQQLKNAGLENFHNILNDIAPEFADRVKFLDNWSHIAFLDIQLGRVKKWYRPGLLLIGDAAHIMSPVGGVGINYAICDAVTAANRLSQPLKNGKVTIQDLASIQRERELPTKIIQGIQTFLQNQLFNNALKENFKPPAILKLPIARNFLASMIAFGYNPPHVKINHSNPKSLV